MSANKKSIKSDLTRLDKKKDEDIDYSDSPELDNSFLTRQAIELPKKKGVIILRVDHEIVEQFKKQGKKGYQQILNNMKIKKFRDYIAKRLDKNELLELEEQAEIELEAMKKLQEDVSCAVAE